MTTQVPVLLIIFNRPEKTRRVVEALRQAKPDRLFVAADGPRPGHPGDIDKCIRARQAATEIDWPCVLRTRFLDQNMGCDPAVSSAIDWFFENAEQGVILEDDCLPHPDYFRFCEELFARYAEDIRVMQISSLAPYASRTHPHDYHFSRAFRCGGGWGTWRRAWAMYSDTLKPYDGSIDQILKAYFPFSLEFADKKRMYETFRLGKRDNWDFKWNLACYAQNALCIVPEKNLMTNIGFDEEGTHTVKESPLLSWLQTGPLEFPLRHPPFVFADGGPEQNLQRKLYRSLSIRSQCGWRLRHLVGAMKDFWDTRP